MRLIDADKLKIDMDCNIDFGGLDNRLMILGWIDNAPTVEERKVGKWIAIDDTHSQCMECGAIFCISSSNEWEINYCPNCGAKMEGVENE